MSNLLLRAGREFWYDGLDFKCRAAQINLLLNESLIFSAFQVVPAGELYEQEFLSLVSSIESRSQHPIAKSVLAVAKKNNVSIYPVVGFKEFPGLGVGGAVEVGAGVYRAVVMGGRNFLNQCGLEVPELLEVSLRKWEKEGALVALGGWDAWVRGILKFVKESDS